MEDLLGHPAVQAGAAPFVAGLAAALALYPVRLSGLAAACGFFAAVYLAGQLDFDSKLLMAAAAAPLLGALADLAFRPTRAAGVVLGILFGLAAFWVFIDVYGYMRAQRLVLHALGVVALTGLTVGFSLLSQGEPMRAGAAGLGLGLGIAASAFIAGTRLPGAWALGAASAGFLIVAMFFGRRLVAGASFTLSIGFIGALLAATAVLRGALAWQYAALFALVPLAVRLPLPQRGEGAVALLYALAVAGGVCALVWMAR